MWRSLTPAGGTQRLVEEKLKCVPKSDVMTMNDTPFRGTFTLTAQTPSTNTGVYYSLRTVENPYTPQF